MARLEGVVLHDRTGHEDDKGRGEEINKLGSRNLGRWESFSNNLKIFL